MHAASVKMILAIVGAVAWSPVGKNGTPLDEGESLITIGCSFQVANHRIEKRCQICRCAHSGLSRVRISARGES